MKLFLLSILLLQACSTLSSLQTAQTLPPGVGRMTYSVAFYESPGLNIDEEKDSKAHSPLRFPVEFNFRFGIFHEVDLGVKFLVESTAVDFKSQIINNSTGFNLSTGLMIMQTRMEPDKMGANGFYSANDMIVPIYFSLDEKYFSYYFSPKYIYRTFIGQDYKANHLAGGSLGVKIGDTFGIFLESSAAKHIYGRFYSYQFNFAFFHKLIDVR